MKNTFITNCTLSSGDNAVNFKALIDYDIILGYPWLKKHGVSINCKTDTLSFEAHHCTHPPITIKTCLEPVRKLFGAYSEPASRSPETRSEARSEAHLGPAHHPLKARSAEPTSRLPEACSAGSDRCSPKACSEAHSEAHSGPAFGNRSEPIPNRTKEARSGPARWPPKVRPVRKAHCSPEVHSGPANRQFGNRSEPILNNAKLAMTKEPELDICMIGAAAFITDAKKKLEGQVFSARMKEVDELLAWHQWNKGKELSIANINTEADLLSESELRNLVPEEYHDLLDVFKKKKLKQLPPHRSYDHQIKLESTASLGRCPLYSISPYKLQRVKEYIKENLEKGFITPSSAPYASPILFVQKKDKGLRFCVDYQKLNSLSKKSPYPIPLIQEIMAQLTGKKYFSRFDIVAAFNNL